MKKKTNGAIPETEYVSRYGSVVQKLGTCVALALCNDFDLGEGLVGISLLESLYLLFDQSNRLVGSPNLQGDVVLITEQGRINRVGVNGHFVGSAAVGRRRGAFTGALGAAALGA